MTSATLNSGPTHKGPDTDFSGNAEGGNYVNN